MRVEARIGHGEVLHVLQKTLQLLRQLQRVAQQLAPALPRGVGVCQRQQHSPRLQRTRLALSAGALVQLQQRQRRRQRLAALQQLLAQLFRHVREEGGQVLFVQEAQQRVEPRDQLVLRCAAGGHERVCVAERYRSATRRKRKRVTRAGPGSSGPPRHCMRLSTQCSTVEVRCCSCCSVARPRALRSLASCSSVVRRWCGRTQAAGAHLCLRVWVVAPQRGLHRLIQLRQVHQRRVLLQLQRRVVVGGRVRCQRLKRRPCHRQHATVCREQHGLRGPRRRAHVSGQREQAAGGEGAEAVPRKHVLVQRDGCNVGRSGAVLAPHGHGAEDKAVRDARPHHHRTCHAGQYRTQGCSARERGRRGERGVSARGGAGRGGSAVATYRGAGRHARRCPCTGRVPRSPSANRRAAGSAEW